jgi:hypothetical protein
VLTAVGGRRRRADFGEGRADGASSRQSVLKVMGRFGDLGSMRRSGGTSSRRWTAPAPPWTTNRATVVASPAMAGSVSSSDGGGAQAKTGRSYSRVHRARVTRFYRARVAP